MVSQEYDFQIIANLMAGKGQAGSILGDLEKFFQNHGQTYRVLAIEEPTPISQIPTDERIKIKKGVVCLGGDGTISETIGYILNNNLEVPLAVVPTGTANIIAATLGLDRVDNFDFLLAGKTLRVDVGMAEYRSERVYFLLGLGLGFEENFLRLTKEKLKSKMGIFSYILAALAELLSLKKIPIKIKSSHSTVNVDVCLLTILNLQPKILRLFPLFKNFEIKSTDQVLNLFYVEYKNFFQAVSGTLFFHIFGKRNLGLVKSVSGEKFFLESNGLVGTQIDGELHQNLPVKVSLLPSPLVVSTPGVE